MSVFEIDAKRFPLVFVKYPAVLTIADVDTFSDDLREVYRRGKLVGVYENATTVFLAEGKYEVAISLCGYELKKAVTVAKTTPTVIDYDAEVKARDRTKG